MPGIGFLFTALGFVRKAAQAAFDFIREKPALATIIALCVVLAAVWHIKSGQVDDANRRADKWHTAWTAMDTAQKEAMRLAIAEKAAKETAANDITKGANDARSITQVANARAGDAYRAANQCVRFTPAEGGRVNADLPRPDSVAGQPASKADDAELVGVTVPSFNACTVNSTDLLNAYAWGQDMVAAGLAR